MILSPNNAYYISNVRVKICFSIFFRLNKKCQQWKIYGNSIQAVCLVLIDGVFYEEYELIFSFNTKVIKRHISSPLISISPICLLWQESLGYLWAATFHWKREIHWMRVLSRYCVAFHNIVLWGPFNLCCTLWDPHKMS